MRTPAFVSGPLFCSQCLHVLFPSSPPIVSPRSLESNQCLKTFEGHSSGVRALALSRLDPSAFVSASLDKTLRLWDIERRVFPSSSSRLYRSLSSSRRATVAVLKGHKEGVHAALFGADSGVSQIASASIDKSLRIFDVRSSSAVKVIAEAHEDEVTALVHTGTSPSLPVTTPRLIVAWSRQRHCECRSRWTRPRMGSATT